MKVRDARERRRAERWGRMAEVVAVAHLVAKGYRIAARNWRTPSGEVDIVARRGDVVVFVEVKARESEEAALMAISRESQRRIEAAGQDWIMAQPDGGRLSWRNDVIAVRRWGRPVHYEDVW